MCEECKSSQWSMNWPYLWLMAWLISPGIFSNMPKYRLLYSAFVIVMLSTLGDDLKKSTALSDLQSQKDCYWIHTHTFVGFIHFCTCAYLMAELGLKMGNGMLFFSTHKNRKPTTHRPYTLTECIDVPQPGTVLCTTFCSQHISTAEINTFRNLAIVSIFLSWVFRPHWPFSTSVKVSQDALKTRISLSPPRDSGVWL